MKARNVILILLTVVALLVVFKAIFPSTIKVDVTLNGTPGAKVVGKYETDGVVHPFEVTLPAKLNFEAKRDFDFRAYKADREDTLSVTLSSDRVNSTLAADSSSGGVFTTYHGSIPGFFDHSSAGRTK